MATKTYDADQVSLVVAGVAIDSGFADGEFLRVEQDTDDFTDQVGTDGEVTRSKTNDRRATVTVLLAQTSDHNQLLSALSNADRELPNGAGMFPISIVDRQSLGSLYEGVEAWVQKPPDVAFGREGTAREWPIRVGKLIRFDAGT